MTVTTNGKPRGSIQQIESTSDRVLIDRLREYADDVEDSRHTAAATLMREAAHRLQMRLNAEPRNALGDQRVGVFSNPKT